MRINPAIFRGYDIRAIVPRDLDAEGASQIGRAFAEFVRQKSKEKTPTILVARDFRPLSEYLRQPFIEGIISTGANCIDLGFATSPMFYFSVYKSKEISGGAMITASHNPGPYSGFKFVLRSLGNIGEHNGLLSIRRLSQKKKAPGLHIGTISFPKDPRNQYIAFLEKHIPYIENIKTLIDAGGGSTALLLPELLRHYNFAYKPLFFDSNPLVSHHGPNSLDPKIDAIIEREYKRSAFDIGVVFDSDGDRASFFDERGTRIRSDIIFAMLARDILKKKKGASFVFDATYPKYLPSFIEAHGGTLIISKVGRIYVPKKVREARAMLGGEESGHIYHSEADALDSALLTMLKIFKIVSESRDAASQLVKDISTAPYIQVSFPVKNAKVLKAIEMKYHSHIASRLDGVTCEFPSWRFNVRLSNTEPIIKATVEADSPDELKKRVKELSRLITK